MYRLYFLAPILICAVYAIWHATQQLPPMP